MANLSKSQRDALPDRAFAYVDSRGNRRLPINDESHVRNALSRFNQVRFESKEARERAFQRLLRAASRYGIAPVGFVARELSRARIDSGPSLPEGRVALFIADLEDSTGHLHALGEREYGAVLKKLRGLIADQVTSNGGCEVDARGDDFFAAFPRAAQALAAAVGVQTTLAEVTWPEGRKLALRIGIHSGTPALTDTGYVGLAVHTTARVCQVGHGGQVLITGETRDELGKDAPQLKHLGSYQLAGLPEEENLYQLVVPGLKESFPALRL